MHAYCTICFGGLEWFGCYKYVRICPTVAFSCTNALKCLLLHKLLGPRVVCLQQRCKSVPMLLSVAQMHWNAYCSTSFWDLEWFVCNKCTNSVPLVAFRCTNPLKCLLHHMLWWPRVVWLQQIRKSAPLLLSVAQIHWNAYYTTWFGGPRVVCLQQMYKSAQLLLSVAQMHWNVCSTTSFGGLEWLVCNKCTNLPHCCFQMHKCTEMPHYTTGLSCQPSACNKCTVKSASVLLSVAQMHWNAYAPQAFVAYRVNDQLH